MSSFRQIAKFLIRNKEYASRDILSNWVNTVEKLTPCKVMLCTLVHSAREIMYTLGTTQGTKNTLQGQC